MTDNEGFIALMVCLSLIEAIVRYRSHTLGKSNIKFSSGSAILKHLAKFLEVSEPNAHVFWTQFRHGLLHQGMVKPTVPYQLDPAHDGAMVSFVEDGTILLNIWKLRNKVIKDLEVIGTKIWRDSTCPLPEVYIELVKHI